LFEKSLFEKIPLVEKQPTKNSLIPLFSTTNKGIRERSQTTNCTTKGTPNRK